MFNYRGCLKSQGVPDINSIERDTYEIYRLFRQKYGVNKAIGFHGISIGGYFALKLATRLKSDEIAFINLDRTFSDFEVMVRNKYGWVCSKLYKCIVEWKLNTLLDFYQLRVQNKVIAYDPEDKLLQKDSQMFSAMVDEYIKRANSKIQQSISIKS